MRGGEELSLSQSLLDGTEDGAKGWLASTVTSAGGTNRPEDKERWEGEGFGRMRGLLEAGPDAQGYLTVSDNSLNSRGLAHTTWALSFHVTAVSTRPALFSTTTS